MSRPSRFFLPAFLGAATLCFSACVGTIYDRTYSNKKNYYKPPPEKKEASAEAILSQVDSKPAAGAPADASGLPPADAGAGGAALTPPAAAGDIPGLPPASPMAPPP